MTFGTTLVTPTYRTTHHRNNNTHSNLSLTITEQQHFQTIHMNWTIQKYAIKE
jgi:hypothetical protein